MKYIINEEEIDAIQNQRIFGEFKFKYIPSGNFPETLKITYKVYLRNYSIASKQGYYWLVICKKNCSCTRFSIGSCSSCADGYSFYEKQENCVKGKDICPYNYYTNNSNQFLVCMNQNEECPLDYRIYDNNTRECRKNDINTPSSEIIFSNQTNTEVSKPKATTVSSKLEETEYMTNEKYLLTTQTTILTSILIIQQTFLANILTTHPTILTTIFTIQPTILTTFLTTQPTILTTFLTTQPNILTTIPTILPSQLIMPTNILMTQPTIITTILTTILKTQTTILTTILTTQSTVLTTIPTILTTQPNILTSQPTILTTQPNMLTSQPTILTTKSTILIIQSIILTSQPTILTFQSTLLSTMKFTANTQLVSNLAKQTIITTIISNSHEVIEIHEEKIDTPKENIINEIPKIIKNIEIGKIYKKIGEDYSIFIYPTNSTYLTATTQVNFSECEALIRKTKKIPDSSIITFFQIEFENDEPNSLINKVEYQAYDENKNPYDLSICDDVNIQVIYSIRNNSLANLTSAKFFKQSGIDIFNINDSFFNDICEPYSESDNDLILEDIIKNIYQNYSLCEEGCIYDKIDLENMTIVCDCKVKDNISLVFTPLNVEYSEGSSTNLDVIKCYNLVFSFNGKKDNIGFWIFGILFLIHLPLIFYYFFKGIKPIREYIFKEMKKYGYIKNNKNKNNFRNNGGNKAIKFDNRKKGKIKIQNNNSLIKKNKKPVSSPPNKKKYGKKINKQFTIKSLKIIDNSSSRNILKGSKGDMIPQINSNLNNELHNEFKNKKFYKTKSKKKLNLNKTKIYKEVIPNKIKNISVLPTQEIGKIKEIKKNLQFKNKQNLKVYTFINMDLNLSRNKKYIPPDSHIILNNYTYEEAIKYDKRELCVIFYIYALSKQIFFHTFLFRSPLEIFPLRLCLFIFIISSDLALNSLFYFNENISKKYLYAKNLFLFAFSDNILVIFLSTFIGFFLLTFLSKLSNCTSAIREVFLKEEEKLKKDKKYKVVDKRKEEILLEIEDILNKYKNKIIILIIIELILMIFFWYFVTAFCHVYKATQISWLIDSSLSILFRAIIELLISFGLAKLYGIAVSVRSHCTYKLVMFLYNFS